MPRNRPMFGPSKIGFWYWFLLHIVMGVIAAIVGVVAALVLVGVVIFTNPTLALVSIIPIMVAVFIVLVVLNYFVIYKGRTLT